MSISSNTNDINMNTTINRNIYDIYLNNLLTPFFTHRNREKNSKTIKINATKYLIVVLLIIYISKFVYTFQVIYEKIKIIIDEASKNIS